MCLTNGGKRVAFVMKSSSCSVFILKFSSCVSRYHDFDSSAAGEGLLDDDDDISVDYKRLLSSEH